jgi:hypothetical protein
MKVIANAQLIKLGKGFFHGATRFDTVNSDGHNISSSINITVYYTQIMLEAGTWQMWISESREYKPKSH